MSLVTVVMTRTELATYPAVAEWTVTETLVETISAGGAAAETLITTTASVLTTLWATPGDTVTLIPPYLNYDPTLEYTPDLTRTRTRTRTLTATEFDLYLVGSFGTIWRTATIEVPPTTTFSSFYPGEFFVADGGHHGWNSWEIGQKVGLITGLVLGVLLTGLLFWSLRRSKKVWISHGAHGANNFERWQNNQHSGYCHYQPPPNLYTGWGLRPWAGAGGANGGPVEAKKDEGKKDDKK